MANTAKASWENQVIDKIKERMRMEKEGVSTMQSETKDAPKKAKKTEPSLFNDAGPVEFAGKVHLSDLVPSWDHDRGTMNPMVTVWPLTEYTAEQALFIPGPMEGYRPNQDALAALAYAVEYTDTPIWEAGEASVGKSSLARYLAHITNRPFSRQNFNGQTSMEDIIGTSSYTGGELKWHDGIIPTTMQIKHAICLLDEPTFGPAEVQAVLQATLERGGRLLMANKPCDASEKYVTPADDFHFILADNTVGMGDTTGRFIGTQPQNTAWLDRMGTFVMVDWLPASDEQAMLEGLYPAISSTLANKIVSVANLLRNGMKQGNLSVCMSMRVTQAWCMHASNLRDVKQAFTLSFLKRLEKSSEREAAENVYRNIFG
jgi:cobaltochelatase CobS